MRHHHALGHPCAPRRVDDVRKACEWHYKCDHVRCVQPCHAATTRHRIKRTSSTTTPSDPRDLSTRPFCATSMAQRLHLQHEPPTLERPRGSSGRYAPPEMEARQQRQQSARASDAAAAPPHFSRCARAHSEYIATRKHAQLASYRCGTSTRQPQQATSGLKCLRPGHKLVHARQQWLDRNAVSLNKTPQHKRLAHVDGIIRQRLHHSLVASM